MGRLSEMPFSLLCHPAVLLPSANRVNTHGLRGRSLLQALHSRALPLLLISHTRKPQCLSKCESRPPSPVSCLRPLDAGHISEPLPGVKAGTTAAGCTTLVGILVLTSSLRASPDIPPPEAWDLRGALIHGPCKELTTEWTTTSHRPWSCPPSAARHQGL